MIDYSFIIIIGHDHCGSTVLCRALENIDGVRCAGEMHWIIDAPVDGVLAMRAGWMVSRYCAVHGTQCPVLDKQFIDSQVGPDGLYERIRSKIGADIVVSSDKQPMFIERYVEPNRSFGLVLFKHPYKAIASDVLTNKMDIESSLNIWTSDYKNMIEWAPRFCKNVLFIEYDDFIDNPIGLISIIAKSVNKDLKFSELLRKDYHFIGGNEKARNRFSISKDERWRDFITEDIREICKSHPSAMSIYNELLNKSNETNGLGGIK